MRALPASLLCLLSCAEPEPVERTLVLWDGYGLGVGFAGESLPLWVSGALPGERVQLLRADLPCDPCGEHLFTEVIADADGRATAPLSVPGQSVRLVARVGDLASAPMTLAVLDPLADTDGDGADNHTEARVLGTLYDQADTDGDGLSDGAEVHPLDAAWPDAWEPEPIRLSDPTSSVYDLEIDSQSHRIVWAEDDGSEVWVAQLDLESDTVTPTDFKGELVATDVAAFQTYQNGPEWLELPGDQASNVLFTQPIGGLAHIHRAWVEQDGWVQETLAPGGAPMGSSWSEVGGGYLGYLGLDPNAPNGIVTSWRRVDSAQVTITPEPLGALRFVPGATEIAALLLEDGQSRLVMVDALTAASVPVSQGDDNVITANAWFPPEEPESMHVTASVGTSWGREHRVDIWRRRGETWSLARSIQPPTRARMSVVRPVVMGERSRVMFIATHADQAELWLASALADETWSRRLLVDPTSTLRDLELATLGDRTVILYRVRLDGVWVVHMVDAGPAEGVDP